MALGGGKGCDVASDGAPSESDGCKSLHTVIAEVIKGCSNVSFVFGKEEGSKAENISRGRAQQAHSSQSMVLVMVRILKKKPAQRARRMGVIEWLPFGKLLKMLLLYMAGKRETVLQAPGSCN